MICKHSCLLGLLAAANLCYAPIANAAKVMYVLGSEVDLTEGNEVIVDLFEARGDEIEYWDNAFLQSDPEGALEAADAADLVFIDESVSSGRADAVIDTSTPVINNEPFAFDNWGMTGLTIAHGSPPRPNNDGLRLDAGTSFGTELDIVASDHAIARATGLSGVVQVYDDVGGRLNWGRPGAGADNVAQLPGFEGLQPASSLFVYESGATLFDGSTAPGMRIGFFLSDTNRGPEPDDPEEPDSGTDNSWEGREATLLTEAGLALLQATIDYALGITQLVPGDFNLNGALDVEDIDLLTAQSAAKTHNLTFDLTSDGQVNKDDVQFWTKELKRTWIGDSNLDGEFNSSDFVAVFSAGKFEQDVNAIWSEGDWDGDGRFTSGDFVAAFVDGGFERGPVAATRSVPEPQSFTIFLGLTALLLRRSRDRRHPFPHAG